LTSFFLRIAHWRINVESLISNPYQSLPITFRPSLDRTIVFTVTPLITFIPGFLVPEYRLTDRLYTQMGVCSSCLGGSRRENTDVSKSLPLPIILLRCYRSHLIKSNSTANKLRSSSPSPHGYLKTIYTSRVMDMGRSIKVSREISLILDI
jgi:hypothetical protein